MKKKLLIIAISVAALAVVGSVYFFLPQPLQIAQKKRLQALIAASFTLKKVWHEGDVDKKLKSGKYKCELPGRYDEDYLRCNPDYLDCFFKNEMIKVEVGGRKYKITARKYDKKYYQIVARSKDNGVDIPSYAALVDLVIDDKREQSLKVLLKDSCLEAYLPQRIYGYGPYQPKDDWRWDNFGQYILLDKFQVSGSDYQHFSKEHGKKHLPNTELSISEMEAYCAFRGKELMPVHIFDAAAFHPGDLGNARPTSNKRGPYPWTTRMRNSFLYRAAHSSSFYFESRYCEKVFTKECLEFNKPKGYDLSSVSWMGMYQVLGGVMEYQRNGIEEKKNLMPSSYLFEANSSWHQLGERAYWNGEGYFPRSFDWNGNPPIDFEPLIGFRCMRYVSEDY